MFAILSTMDYNVLKIEKKGREKVNELGNYLKELRKEKSLSIRKASEEIGISHTYLDSLEKGYDPRTKKERKPTPDVLGKISKYYDVPFIKLLNMSGAFKEFAELDTEESLKFIENDLLLEEDDEINITKILTSIVLGKSFTLRLKQKLSHQDSLIIVYFMNKIAENLVKREEPLNPDKLNEIGMYLDRILEEGE